MVTVQAMISLLCCSLEVAAAGILTARRQFKFLVGAMVLVFGIMAVYCQAVRTYNWGLPGVWWGEHRSDAHACEGARPLGLLCNISVSACALNMAAQAGSIDQ